MALHLHRTVQELEWSMTWLEYLEWMDVYRVQPWGCAVEDDRAARIVNSQLTEHVPTERLFPRSAAVLKKVQQKDEEAMAARLRAAFLQHNVNHSIREAALHKQEGTDA